MNSSDAIAIIGIGCRLPGKSNSPQELWRNLNEQVDAVRVLPKERFNTRFHCAPKGGDPRKSYSKWGGLIDRFDQFDAGFFGISPREAEFMDPQHRLLLETSWRAIEDAGVRLDLARGTNIGVFAGVSTLDYHLMQSQVNFAQSVDIFSATGSVHSIAANRVSYIFNLTGPSFAVDTACSSSMIAINQACISLREGGCEMALAGGANSISSPMPYFAFSKMNMLSPRGRCHAFDSRADGFVRGEGAGMLLLKPLEAALRDGDSIYATILETGANQDGKTNGITVPNPIAQRDLTLQTCEKGNIDPKDVVYAEAHGTGTPVGDPLEAHALGDALGKGRKEKDSLLIGSIKTNIGHLEASSGVAGVIKTAMVLKYGQVPPNLNFRKPNPNIDFAGLKLKVVDEPLELPASRHLPMAMVNSFGFGGANANALLQAPPKSRAIAKKKLKRTPPKAKLPEGRPLLLPLYSNTHDNLPMVAGEYRKWLESYPDQNVADFCLAAALKQSPFNHNVTVVADDRQALLDGLAEVEAESGEGTLVEGSRSVLPFDAPVWVFSGQGPQWHAMGRELFSREPVFRDVIEKCDQIMSGLGDWSLIEELHRSEEASRISETSIAQPAIFAIQAGLAELWKSWGLQPGAVVGHSVGEVAAAYVSGILSFEDAARVIYLRGAAMEATPLRGRMLAASLTEAQARQALRGFEGKAHIGAINGPQSVTISGDTDAVESIAKRLSKKQVFNRFLRVNYAFHSHHMDPARDDFFARIGTIQLSAPKLPVYSSVTGVLADETTFGVEYWWRNIREPVRFAEAIESIIEDRQFNFVELSPHPVLSASVGEILSHCNASGESVPTLRRGEDESRALAKAFARLSSLGASLDWKSYMDGDENAVPLPQHPWNPQTFWLETEEHHQFRVIGTERPYLGERAPAPHPTWHTLVNVHAFPEVKEHQIQETTVFPAAAYIETALEGGDILYPDKPVVLEDLSFTKALFIPEEADLRMQFTVDPLTSQFAISSQNIDEDDKEWAQHCTGRVLRDSFAYEDSPVDIEELKETALYTYPGDNLYQSLIAFGFYYGPQYQGVKKVFFRGKDTLCQVELDRQTVNEMGKFVMHPVLLDQVFQTTQFCLSKELTDKLTDGSMPMRCDRIRILRKPKGNKFYVLTEPLYLEGKVYISRMKLLDLDGNTIATVDGYESQQVVKTSHSRAFRSDGWLYQNQWRERPLEDATSNEESLLAAPTIDEESRVTPEKLFEFSKRADQVAMAYLARFLAENGVGVSGGSIRRSAITSAFNQTKAKRLAKILDQAAHLSGTLRSTPQGWKVPARLCSTDPASLWNKALADFPQAYPEWILIRRFAEAWDDLLAGKVTPESLIRKGQSMTLAEHMEQDSIARQKDNIEIASALAAAIKPAIEDSRRTWKIAHFQGGSGGLASYLLPKLPQNGLEYLFAEIDDDSRNVAEKKLFDFSHVSTSSTKVGQRFRKGDLEAGSQDILILESPPVSPRPLKEALQWCSRFLRPGGRIALRVAPERTLWQMLTAEWGREAEYPSALQESLSKSLTTSGFEEVTLKESSGFFSGFCTACKPALQDGETAVTTLSLENLRYSPPSCALIFSDRKGFTRKIETLIREEELDIIKVLPGKSFEKRSEHEFVIRPEEAADMNRLFKAVSSRYQMERLHLIYGWALDTPKSVQSNSILNFARRALIPLLSLSKVMNQEGGQVPASLQVITQNAASVHEGEKEISPESTLLPGFMRTYMSETFGTHVRLLDLSSTEDEDEFLNLMDDILERNPETEIAYRKDRRFVLRLAQASMARQSGAVKEQGSFRLEIENPGIMDSLVHRSLERTQPKRGEIEVEVRAAALNFRDVLKALDIYPSDSDLDQFVGDECSGVITRVGPGVTDWKPGDEIIAMGAGCFASHMTLQANQIMAKPDSVSFEEAVTMPVAFLTAHYALNHLGRIRKGETILIQAGTGGVGLAAIQVARQAGAKIMASAGDPTKRQFLRFLGIEHVFDSRSTAFQEQVMNATDGHGVDLVLNSLGGDAIEKGLSCLGQFGRFLEIGKRDIYANRPVGLRPFRNNVSMHVIDLGVLMQARDERFQELFHELSAKFDSGAYKPILFRVFPMSAAVEAFRCMSQAKHMGKIVLTNVDDSILPKKRPLQTFEILPPDSAYLITGGMSGFGLETAIWLCGLGAKHIYLLGRTLRSSKQLTQLLDYAGRHQTQIHIVQGDVTKKKDVERIFSEIRKSGVSLKGIFHSAMVLDDSLLQNMSSDQLMRVIEPKVAGGWNLHEASLDCDLDYFVMYSSVSSLMGSKGQANYSAANSFLDGLAHYRRSYDLPATTINWGQLGQVGVASENEVILSNLKKQGLSPLPMGSAFKHLERLLINQHVQTAVVPIDWNQLFSQNPKAQDTPSLEEQARLVSTKSGSATGSLKELVLATPVSKRKDKMISLLQEEIGTILRSPSSKISPSRALSQLGLDSLMTFELVLRIEAAFEVSMPPGKLKVTSTVDDLAEYLLELLGGSDLSASSSTATTESGPRKGGKSASQSVSPLPEDCLVCYRDTGKQAPLVAIPSTGGLASIYSHLPPLLPDSSSFYALQTRALFSAEGEYPTLEDMCSAYATALLKRFEDRPIRLIGFSNGGYFARQIAYNIESRGGRVDWLGLIDMLHESNDPRPETREFIARRLHELLSMWQERLGLSFLEGDALVEATEELSRKMATAPDGAGWHSIGANWFKRKGHVESPTIMKIITGYFRIWEQHFRMVKAHTFPVVEADVHHWTSNTQFEFQGKKKRRNGPALTNGLYAETALDGSHFDLIEPKYLKQWTPELIQILAKRDQELRKKSPAS